MTCQSLRGVLAVAFMAASVGRAAGQSAQAAAPAQPLTLEAAITYAAAHYPSLRASQEQLRAANANVSVARTAYLPRLDALWQSNRGTTNNVFGQVLPQSVIPALSGPVLPATSSQSVWGSATGALLSWEPLDFGLRDASIAGAEAGVTRARAAETLTELDVESAVANAFLALASAERLVTAAQADVSRRAVLARAVHVLVDNQLRPGAEASRADAERAAADTRLIQAKQTAAIARVTLALTLGLSSSSLTIDATSLLTRAPSGEIAQAPASAHPLARLRQATIEEARAQETILMHTDRPRLFLQGSVAARGTGADPSGTFDGSLSGLGLDRVNWAAGIQIQFPNVFDFSSLHARRTAADAATKAETARYDEAVLAVTEQQAIAVAMADAARAVAANTPIQLAAAQQSEAQARARYDAGLTDIVAVADAQSLLAQADAQDQLARVDMWRALLAEAVARGDLGPFVDLLRPGGGR
jgi:outer membrane protein TolC